MGLKTLELPPSNYVLGKEKAGARQKGTLSPTKKFHVIWPLQTSCRRDWNSNNMGAWGAGRYPDQDYLGVHNPHGTVLKMNMEGTGSICSSFQCEHWVNFRSLLFTIVSVTDSMRMCSWASLAKPTRISLWFQGFQFQKEQRTNLISLFLLEENPFQVISKLMLN